MNGELWLRCWFGGEKSCANVDRTQTLSLGAYQATKFSVICLHSLVLIIGSSRLSDMASITSWEKSHGLEHPTQSIREYFDYELAEEESRSSNQSTLWSSIREFILNINYRYAQSNEPATFQHDIHDLWYMFIRTAQVTDAGSPSQDRHVAQLIYAKELGTGRRTGQTADDTFKLWTDLPYLLEDMREAWEKQSMKLDPTHRRNFAVFTARLLALGVCDSSISWCALWLLRSARNFPTVTHSS